MLRAYCTMSRTCTAETLLVMQPFAPMLFRQGELPGPHLMMEFWRGKLAAENVEAAWNVTGAARWTGEIGEQEDSDANLDHARYQAGGSETLPGRRRPSAIHDLLEGDLCDDHKEDSQTQGRESNSLECIELIIETHLARLEPRHWLRH